MRAMRISVSKAGFQPRPYFLMLWVGKSSHGLPENRPNEPSGTADDFLDRYAALPSAARNSAGVRPPSASLRLSVL